MESATDKKINHYFFLAIIIILGAFLFYSLVQFFTAFLGAVMFYVLSKPFANWLIGKKNWSKSVTAVLVIFISFFVILLPIAFLISVFANKISGIATDPQPIADYIKKVDATLLSKYNIHLISENTIKSIQTTVTGFITTILNQGLGIFTTIIMMYFFLFFLIKNINRLEAALVFYLPFSKEKIKIFGNELVQQTYGNALGIPLVAIASGTAAYIGYCIVGLPDSGFWGIVTGFASMIPIIGTGMVWIPVAIYFFAGAMNWQGIFIIIWGAILLGSLDNVIRFLLAKRMADVHPIVTVLGIIVGLKYFGFTGLIFGPLLISYFLILLRIYYLEYKNPVKKKSISSETEVEAAAIELIRAWNLGFDPIPNVLEMLEEKGIRVIEIDAPVEFDGLSAHVGDIPVIVINKNFSVERKRFTALHELGHLVLTIEEGADEEKICHAFAGALLLPDNCLEKLLGDKRSNIAPGELVRIKEQYGISAQAIMMRAHLKGIINKNSLDRFWKSMAGNKKEQGLGRFAGNEKSYRFEQMVFRLAAEDVVSLSKAANLAGMKLAQFRDQLDAIEL